MNRILFLCFSFVLFAFNLKGQTATALSPNQHIKLEVLFLDGKASYQKEIFLLPSPWDCLVQKGILQRILHGRVPPQNQ